MIRAIFIFGLKVFYVLIKSSENIQLGLLYCVLHSNNWIVCDDNVSFFFHTNSAGLLSRMLRINLVKLFEQQSSISEAAQTHI